MNVTSWVSFRNLRENGYSPGENLLDQLNSALKGSNSRRLGTALRNSPVGKAQLRCCTKMVQEEQIKQLVAQSCQYPADSWERKRYLNHLIRVIVNSGRLWRENALYYEDALQQTWLYLVRNLCEGNSCQPYNPARSSVITWLNNYLKYRLLDFRTEKQRDRQLYQQLKSNDPEPFTEAPQEIPPILEETRNWVGSDPDGDLTSTHMKKRPDITCQKVILRRLPPETGWEELAAELNCPLSTLYSFYKRQCRPRLRQFAKSQAYI